LRAYDGRHIGRPGLPVADDRRHFEFSARRTQTDHVVYSLHLPSQRPLPPELCTLRRAISARLLPPDPKILNKLAISIEIVGLKIAEQPAPATDKLQQAPPRVVILLVCLEMLS